MAKNAHLTLDERATIEGFLREGASFTEIGRELGKDPSTISKEVKNHSQTIRKHMSLYDAFYQKVHHLMGWLRMILL